MWVYECVCVCVRERERERDTEKLVRQLPNSFYSHMQCIMGNKCQVFNLQLNNMQASSASHKHSPRIITQTHTYTHTCKPPVMETTMFWL